MRPRIRVRGSSPGKMPSVLAFRFNEAADQSPRIGDESHPLHPDVFGFNEAADQSPRIAQYRRAFMQLNAASMRPRMRVRGSIGGARARRADPGLDRFNEAADQSPRIGRRARIFGWRRRTLQ